MLKHLAEYCDLAPAPANAVGIFKGQWSSAVPGMDGTGSAALFGDGRIAWLLSKLGSVERWHVLELGPLEAGHTAMLERAGAEVTAIEANHLAFLRCLAIKNLLGLRARFLLGDFMKSFGAIDRADLVVASGVLYHMTDPVGLLRRAAQVAPRLFLWTHYFEPDLGRWRPEMAKQVGTKWRPDLARRDTSAAVPVRMVPQSYGEALAWEGFCGGPETQSYWIYRDDLLALLADLGFDRVEVAFDTPDHQNGPALALLAERT